MGKTKGTYEPEFPVGTHVRIMEFEALERFQQEWKWHNPLRDEQLKFAGREAQVASVTFYHGGDELYQLKEVPGLWHEACLAPGGAKPKDQGRRLQRAIREGLLQDWDPIGVRGIPEAHDEYYGYIGRIYELLNLGASLEEIFKFLWWLETEHMGLRGDRSATERFARWLIELREEMDSHRVPPTS